ncbi:DUF2970 domain-containing protein [Pandoraea sp.]|uniref:DUF2970 domain-containing protein n=1 Tax=Pandoraea sp. TaxID=1883445 RepID=UPI00120BC546|nr:DUF2970 domain-containing protein [Pandoraea sp.]MBU6492271.1 DUF2970 domain-containing protein [Burkholderiales bacterium]MDE2288086.1 DUF2970 domain-containing protein [Burkholderiales bacterium]MDE2611633.1 DUF2970 domain-containing protein [Burkholderiales bacterium]TAL52555.1 MAG: DUF2970 domain-containing protein [Pandoraea sp.]TAM14409.1 MAG: DUF2970 domain-containing protein [Pandoraea sp.]
MDDLKRAVRRKPSFGQSMRAVFWSFFGVRKGKDHDRDMAQLNPVHVIVAGLVGAALFIAILIVVVRVAINLAK